MRFLILLGLVIVLTSALGEERELGGLEENQLVDADRRMTSEYIYYEFTYLCMILLNPPYLCPKSIPKFLPYYLLS